MEFGSSDMGVSEAITNDPSLPLLGTWASLMWTS